MDTQRLILFFIFSFSLLLLWDAWEKENRPKPPPAPPAAQGQAGIPAPAKPPATPGPPAATGGASTQGIPALAPARTKGETVRVQTDLVAAEIDTLGGTLRRLELLRHKATEDESKKFVLFSDARRYEAQSGLAGDLGANHRSLWTVQPGERSLADGRDAFEVRLTARANGLSVVKVYTFRRNSYVIDVALADRLVRAAGFRNVVAHAYDRLDMARVFQAASAGPADLRAFFAAIARRAAPPA